MTKSTHIHKIMQQRESWVQAIWSHQVLPSQILQCTDGEKIEILFPGWLNKGTGPDFIDAHIMVGDCEYHGAVEIHLQSSSWYSHQHHLNPVYNAVVLHVVLDGSASRTTIREDGMSVPEIELRPLLDENMLALLGEESELLSDYDRLPGQCGLLIAKWGAAPLKKLLGHAAENRMEQKTERIREQWETQDPEQLLFQLIFKTLGYSAYHHAFEEIAQLYPLSALYPLLQQPYRVARTAILARWFGACGLLSDNIPALKHPSLRKEYHQWLEEWKQVPNPCRVSEKFSKNYRPQNSPERRLVGMFHHLYHLNADGLLKRWLRLLMELEKVAAEKTLKRTALKQTQNLFVTPEWEVWQACFSLSKSPRAAGAQLIGKDRQIIIWANAIIPFFLTYARLEKWVELEKLLYRLFIVLPPEPSNYRTHFMEKRLLPFPLAELKPRTLRIEQGLIQMHHNFCQSFDQGCVNCQIIPFLGQFQQELGATRKDSQRTSS
ncbi:MAG: DUF2851 family protein [SAR324 cluster bacterium]|nr:DUF2851 family protein [SAR324 cluster bacterium]